MSHTIFSQTLCRGSLFPSKRTTFFVVDPFALSLSLSLSNSRCYYRHLRGDSECTLILELVFSTKNFMDRCVTWIFIHFGQSLKLSAKGFKTHRLLRVSLCYQVKAFENFKKLCKDSEERRLHKVKNVCLTAEVRFSLSMARGAVLEPRC